MSRTHAILRPKKGVVTESLITPWMAACSLPLTETCIVAGVSYNWPYPPDQLGTVWLFVSKSVPGGQPGPPDNVYLVRAAKVLASALGGTIDGVTLRSGDRVVSLDANAQPQNIYTWDGTDFIDPLVIPDRTLVVIEDSNGVDFGNHAWWMTAQSAAPNVYATVCRDPHVVGNADGALGLSTNAYRGATDHVFMLLTRRPDGMYAARPAAVSSNVTTPDPVSLVIVILFAIEDRRTTGSQPSGLDVDIPSIPSERRRSI